MSFDSYEVILFDLDGVLMPPADIRARLAHVHQGVRREGVIALYADGDDYPTLTLHVEEAASMLASRGI